MFTDSKHTIFDNVKAQKIIKGNIPEIEIDIKPFHINKVTAELVHNMLNRYKNAQLGKNFDKSIMVQYQTVFYWQKVVCKPIYVQSLYIGFISSLNKSTTLCFFKSKISLICVLVTDEFLKIYS